MHKRFTKDERGITHVIIFVLVVVVSGAIIFTGSRVIKLNKNHNNKHYADSTVVKLDNTQKTNQQDTRTTDSSPPTKAADCSNRLSLQTPVDLTMVSGILLPGQWRNNEQGLITDYKSHGGFRFDNFEPDAITVKAPMDAKITSASHYWQTDDKQIQYLLTFTTDCGVMYRFDHIKEVAPQLKGIFEPPFPAAVYNNSFTTDLKAPIKVKAGDTIAVSVGLSKSSVIPKSVFVDFGVWDTTKENEAAKDAAFAKLHSEDRMARIGLCWIDLLPSDDAAKVKKLDISSQNQKSDFCTWAK